MSNGDSVRVLVACDKFKGSLAAMEVAEAVSRGLPEEWEMDLCPIADGGEGFVEVLTAVSGGELISVEVGDPLGRRVMADYGVAEIDGRRVAFVEMSAASGLWRVAANERDPMRSSTFGTGELIRHAAEVSKAERILVGLGGSATNDGGAGMAAALGVKFLDATGGELNGFPDDISKLVRIDESDRVPLPEIVVACDVDNPLCGPRGASAVFGPQKGASPENVASLDGILQRLADSSAGKEIAETAGTGAAGGIGFGLVRFAGARLVSGFDLVAEAIRLEEKIAVADLVITGEGSLDLQTLGGKGPAGVAALAKKRGVPVVAVAGRVEPQAAALFDAVVSLEMFALSKEESIARAAELLEEGVKRNCEPLRKLLN
jgi:glycerate kinase